MADDQAAAMAELSQAIAGDILSLPELRDPGWDTFSMVAEVSDDVVAITAYRYAGSGPPVSTAEPEGTDLYWELRDRTRGTGGQAWDVVLVKIHRDTSNLVMNFVSGVGADLWRITPENMVHLPESLRPRPEDFEAVDVDAVVDVADDEVPPVSATVPLVVEVLADGGIRLTNLDGATGLASLRSTLDWIAEANRAGAPVRLRGDLTAPAAAAVAEEVRRLASSLDEELSEPAPWPKRYSSLQTAAYNGLTDQVADLLDRGISPDVGRGRTSPHRLAMQHGHAEVLAALRDAGARLPRGLAAPAVLPDAVVLRAYSPPWIWWLLVPFVALAALAMADGAYVLGQREAGDKQDVYAKSAFDKEQRAEMAELRFVPLYAARGFLSPGFERLLARHVDRANVTVGPIAEKRVWST